MAIDSTELVEHVVNQLEDAMLDQELMLNCYSYDGWSSMMGTCCRWL